MASENISTRPAVEGKSPVPGSTPLPGGSAPKGVGPPRGTRAGSKPHLQADAKFAVVHPCSYTCRVGETVGRDRFAPRSGVSGEEKDRVTNEAIERLMKLGAIVHQSDADADAEDGGE